MFPLEINDEIIKYLDREDLENWSVCNHIFCDQASRRLWRVFHICPELFGNNLDGACDAILRLPYRARHIHTLIISPTSEYFRASLSYPRRTQYTPYQFPSLRLEKRTWTKLMDACRRLEHLEHLVIEAAHGLLSKTSIYAPDFGLEAWLNLDAVIVRENIFFPNLVAFSTETRFSAAAKLFCEQHPAIRRLEIRTRDVAAKIGVGLLPNLRILRARARILSMLAPAQCITEVILDVHEAGPREMPAQDILALRGLLNTSETTRTLRLPTIYFSSALTLSSNLSRLSSPNITTLEFAWDPWIASCSGDSVFDPRVAEALLQWGDLKKLECRYHWIGDVRGARTTTTLADVQNWGIQNSSILDVTFSHADVREVVLFVLHFRRKNMHAEWCQV